jgi:DNA-binding NtrC family response regulator
MTPGVAKPTVALIDPDGDARIQLVGQIEAAGCLCRAGAAISDLEKILSEDSPRILILDASFLRETERFSGAQNDWNRRIRPIIGRRPWVAIASRPSIEQAVYAIRLGAADYLPKPADFGRIQAVLQEFYQGQPNPKGDAVIQKFAEACETSANGANDRPAQEGVEVASVIDLTKTPSMDDIERQAILFTLTQTSGNVGEAARVLGLGPATVYRKIKRYGIRAKHFASMSHSV